MHEHAVRSKRGDAPDPAERAEPAVRRSRVPLTAPPTWTVGTADSLFPAEGTRIQRSTTIRRKGDRERDRRKGRERQRRTRARDRKQRGEDEGNPEERAEAARREADSQRWEEQRRQRRDARAAERAAQHRALLEGPDDDEGADAEEERQRQQEEAERKRREEDERKRREEEERKQREEAERKEREEEERQRQEEEAERKQREEEERQRKEREERKRREEEELRRKEEERQREEERERLRQEDAKAAKQREEDERKRKVEVERTRQQLEASSTDFEASDLSPDQFDRRAKNLIEQAKKKSLAFGAAQKAVEGAVGFAKSQHPPRTKMEGRRADEARAALRKLRDAIGAPPPPDPLAGPRATLATEATRVATRATNELPSAEAKSAQGQLVKRLRLNAANLEANAKSPAMTNHMQAIEGFAREVSSLEREIDQYLQDRDLITDEMAEVVGGSAFAVQPVLAELYKGLSKPQISLVVPALAVRPLTVSLASDLVAAAKVAVGHLPGGIASLPHILPVASLPRLANAILLAEALNLGLPQFTTNCTTIQDAANGFAPSKLAWFVGIPLPTIAVLTTTFGTSLPSFADWVPTSRVLAMFAHNVPPARMKTCFDGDRELLGRWGMSDKAWTHLTTAKLNKDRDEISGAHDGDVFRNYCQTLINEGWTRERWTVQAHGSIAAVRTYRYRFTKPGKETIRGTKTVIDGLITNANVWKPRMEAAAWDCITNNGIQGVTWSGTEGGTTWTGFTRKSMIDTIYPQ